MRCTEPTTDRTAQVTVHNGSGAALGEYNAKLDNDGALSCYIPVEENDPLTIKWTFAGTTHKYQVDVWMDGVLRCSKSSDMASKGKSRGKVDAVLSQFNNRSRTHKNPILVKPSRRPLLPGTSRSIGTIEIVFSVLRRLGESYPAPSENRIDQDSKQSTTYVGIVPTYEIDIGRPTKTSAMSPKMHRTNLNVMRADRPGTGPWATFRYHYRSKGWSRD